METLADNEFDADVNNFQRLYPSLRERINPQYYDSNTFKALNISASTKHFSVIRLSIWSIRANCDASLSFLFSFDHEFDVICFTESSWKEGEQEGEYFKNHNTFYSC